MSIVTIIKNIIEAIEADSNSPASYLSFYYGSKGLQNINAEDLSLPICFLDYPVTRTNKLEQSGSATESFNLDLFFFDKVDNLDSEIEADHREVIDRCDEYARQFRIRCQQSSDIYQVDGVSTTEMINALDSNLSGVWLKIRLIKQNNQSICI